jgi:hypothetical protein
MDIEYWARFNELNARYYTALKNLLAGVGLFFGSGVVYAFTKDAGFLLPSGILLAIVTTIGYTVGPGDRAQAHLDQYKAYRTLAARADDLDDKALAKAVKEQIIQARPHAVEALQKAAWNSVVIAHGMDSKTKKLTPKERFFAALA